LVEKREVYRIERSWDDTDRRVRASEISSSLQDEEGIHEGDRALAGEQRIKKNLSGNTEVFLVHHSVTDKYLGA